MSLSPRFLPHRLIAAEIAERFVSSRGRDPFAQWPEEVIVPSAGMAEAITRELLRLLPNGIAGLRLQSIEELARRVVNDAGQWPHVSGETERRLAMRTAVRSIEHPMMESRGIAAMLERSYRDVRDSGLTLDELRTRAQSRPIRNRERTRLIVRVWEEYERLITRLGATDGAEVLRRATAMIAEGADVRPQLLAGFYDMTGMQLAVVDALSKAGRLAGVWIPIDPGDEAYRFALSFAGRFGATETDAFAARASAKALAFDTKQTELREVCREVRALLEKGVPASEIGIVARSLDDADAHLLARFAEEEGFRTTLDDDMPLLAHRVGRGVISLLRLRERGFPRAEVLELVRDGLRTKTSINVDKADAETRSARIAGGTSEELRMVRRRSPVIEDYVALVAELEALTANIDVAFLAKLPGLFRLETKLDIAAAEALDGIADLFRRAAVWNRGLDLSAVIDAIENESLSRRGGSGNRVIWAGEILRFRGRSFRHLFAVRMQDDLFPQRRNEDPLVPDSDRRLLGVHEIGDGRDEEQLLFQLLFDASEELRFSHASTDGFGKVLRRSRLIRHIEIDEYQPHDASAPRTAPERPLQLLAKAGTKSAFDGYLGPDLLRTRIDEVLLSVTPTQLEDFGECPQKFLLKWIHGVKDLDDPEREIQINHRDKGTIDHEILEELYRGLRESDIHEAAAALPHLPQPLLDRLDALVDVSFAKLEADVPPFNRTVRELERRATKRLLREFIAQDIGELDELGLVPKHFEYRFGPRHRNKEAIDHPESFVIDARGVSLRVDGTIDRIDVASDGRHRIVDYKSGKALRHVSLADKIDRGVRLQLALYAMAVSDFFGTDPSKVSGTIKPLVIGEKRGKFDFALAEKRAGLIETLGLFVTSIMNGVFPAFPNSEDFDSCKYCPVNHSCRTKHDFDERYAVQQSKDPKTLLSAGTE